MLGILFSSFIVGIITYTPPPVEIVVPAFLFSLFPHPTLKLPKMRLSTLFLRLAFTGATVAATFPTTVLTFKREMPLSIQEDKPARTLVRIRTHTTLTRYTNGRAAS
jgi:hypothetical protein